MIRPWSANIPVRSKPRLRLSFQNRVDRATSRTLTRIGKSGLRASGCISFVSVATFRLTA